MALQPWALTPLDWNVRFSLNAVSCRSHDKKVNCVDVAVIEFGMIGRDVTQVKIALAKLQVRGIQKLQAPVDPVGVMKASPVVRKKDGSFSHCVDLKICVNKKIWLRTTSFPTWKHYFKSGKMKRELCFKNDLSSASSKNCSWWSARLLGHQHNALSSQDTPSPSRNENRNRNVPSKNREISH